MSNSTNVYLPTKYREWLDTQPRTFNLSEIVRNALDVLMITGPELIGDIKNDSTKHTPSV